MAHWRVGFGILCLSLVAATGWSWSGSGHQIVALLAWKQMSAQEQTSAAALLRNLPEFQTDIGQRVEGLPGDKRDSAIFALAATWPDIVRSGLTASHKREHHGIWHYTDIPMLEAGSTMTAASLPQPEWERKPGEPIKNSVQALREQIAILDDVTTPAERRAVALAWILHLSGDMQQPLHSAMLVSERFPKGDAGGNYFLIAKDAGSDDDRPYQNLHHFWDAQFGKEFPFDSIEAKADDIAVDPKLTTASLAAKGQELDPIVWTRENAEIARKQVYLLDSPQPLQGTVRDSSVPPPAVPDEYRSQALELSRHQVALGGARLANILHLHLK